MVTGWQTPCTKAWTLIDVERNNLGIVRGTEEMDGNSPVDDIGAASDEA